MYILNKNQLRVSEQYLKNGDIKKRLSGTRLILLQHFLPDSEQFVNLLAQTGADIFKLIAKPYSLDKSVYDRLSKLYDVEIGDYDKFDNTDYLDKLLQFAIQKSKLDELPILILEVGGYFSEALKRLNSEDSKYIKGVVEVTTFGYNKYLKTCKETEVPIYSVARSPIKSIEARYVGRSSVLAVNQEFRKIGVSIAGRKALVIGFGMIGRSVAEALKSHNVNVSVYDKKEFAKLNAYTLGYLINNSKYELLKNADIIFSATANRALSYEDIEHCKNGVILASAGSRGNEFDVEGLKNNSMESEKISENIDKYKISTNKDVFLMRNGTAVNFIIKSCPDEIVDLIHAEVLVCASILLNENRKRTKIGIVNETPFEELHKISKDWLKHVL
ncbi:adenosylhomocysteinase [Olleya sp. R77988]|uniref:adenosylhomocysteinase n=1 Tax=Olleya sp. R77988 TaxID=3093875 RepID=UPI0037C644A5